MVDIVTVFFTFSGNDKLCANSSELKQLTILISLFITVGLCGQQTERLHFQHLGVEDGFSSGTISCFYQDDNGLMWVGTSNGLNLYDGRKVELFKASPLGLNSSQVTHISKGPDGQMWVFTILGLNIFDPSSHTFESNQSTIAKKLGLADLAITEVIKLDSGWAVIHGSTGLSLLDNNASLQKTYYFDQLKGFEKNALVTDLSASADGGLWLVLNTGKVCKFKNGSFVSILEFGSSFFKDHGRLTYEIYVDCSENIWVFSQQTETGIALYNFGSKTWSGLTSKSVPYALNNNNIRSITEDTKGRVWIGTDHGGIQIFDPASGKLTFVMHDVHQADGLSQNSIISLYRDKTGNIWVGTFKNGVNVYQPDRIHFTWVQNEAWNNQSLPSNDVNCFAEGANGEIWMGTNGNGLLQYHSKFQSYKTFNKSNQYQHGLTSDVIVNLLMDSQKRLWIGTYQGGVNVMHGDRIERIPYGKGLPGTSGPNVWDIFEDSRGNVWFASLADGIDVLVEEDGHYEHFDHDHYGEPQYLETTFFNCISEDARGLIWIGGGNGIELIDKSTFEVKDLAEQGYQSLLALRSSIVTDLMNDGQGRMWIGTSEGLYVFEISGKELFRLEKDETLKSVNIQSIIRDEGGQVWVSSSNGLFLLSGIRTSNSQLEVVIRRYTTSDGLQGMVFNKNAAIKLRDGRLLFGGSNGYNSILPSVQTQEVAAARVIFTDFKVLNQSVKTQEGARQYGFAPGSFGKLSLSHRDNVFSLEFTSTDYIHAARTRYSYRLIGFDKTWTEVADLPGITYTNLDAGDYTLEMKCTNSDGTWSDEVATLQIVIKPPFWKTGFAYAIYLLLICGVLYIGRNRALARQRRNFELEQERREAKQLRELNTYKLNFFTNISHELRTPISLILAPIERLMERDNRDGDQRQLHIIRNNANRLLKMVDQLLDFRKMEMGKNEFHSSTGDLVRFVEEIVLQFSEPASQKNIDLKFDSQETFFLLEFDKDKMEKILLNLLSNAMKFTPEEGEIRVKLEISQDKYTADVRLAVTDTGIGIPVKYIDQIFDRYYTVNERAHQVNHGTGIGLSIVKEFVAMHRGEISVESEEGVGSAFTVTMNLDLPAAEVSQESKSEKGSSNSLKGAKKLVLVEDNAELSAYLTEMMEEEYETVSAKDGIEGWRTILNEMPDIVISDVIMPGRNGLELCEKVKSDARTRHIPVILLTADQKEASRLSGLKNGADDFITKPFNVKALKARVNNLVFQRGKLQDTYSKKISIETTEAEIVSRDEIFIKDAVDIVHREMEDSELNVEKLAAHLNMSRVALYKRLVSVTGKSPHQFIKDIRLDHARQLLEKSQMTIAEVAYKVGYNDRKYFSRHFKEAFGRIPSEWPKST